MNDILRTALEEERQLIERLEAVRAVIRAYGGAPSVISPAGTAAAASHAQRQRTVRTPSDSTCKIRGLLADLLRGKTSPTPTRELLAFLDSKGIAIGGKNPIATLSALLSHAEEFEPVGRKGWLLISRMPDVEASGAANDSGAATPLFERQKEEASSV